MYYIWSIALFCILYLFSILLYSVTMQSTYRCKIFGFTQSYENILTVPYCFNFNVIIICACVLRKFSSNRHSIYKNIQTAAINIFNSLTYRLERKKSCNLAMTFMFLTLIVRNMNFFLMFYTNSTHMQPPENVF